jgi:periplasmic protein TonB
MEFPVGTWVISDYMTSTNDNQFFFPAWGISLVLHGVVVGLAFAFVAQVKPVLQEETFQWDVALVEEARLDSRVEQVSSVVASAQPPVKKLLPARTKPTPQTSKPVMPTEQQVETPQPTIEQVPQIDQNNVEASQIRHEPIEQRIVEVDASTTEPALEPNEPEPLMAESSPEPITATPAPNVPVIQEVPTQAVTHDSPVDHTPAQMAIAQASGPEVKEDYRWLAESLWRRVAELKHYPNSARMNGEEGKVIVKAVIRSDGYLVKVFVQKSSGNSVLDGAAMEAVKLASPLHMKHAIAKPQIVVSLPIVYSLAN